MKKALLTILMVGVLVTMLVSVPRSKVVVEIGTGTWCQYCPGAAMGADDLVTNGQPVACVENHNGDTFANVYSNARNTYYNITGFPTANFDGLNPYVGGSHTASMYSNYLPRVTARMAIPSHFNIMAGGAINGNTVTLSVTVDKTEADTNTNLRLHSVITESGIQFAWQGQTHLEFVNRLMAPDQNGTTVDFGTGSQVTVPLTMTLDPSWVMANLKLVLFLQNNSSKEILQGVEYSLAEIGGAYPVSVDHIDFPNIYLTGATTVPMTITNFWNVTATGTINSSNPVFSVSAPTRLDFTIPPYQARTYNVTFTPTSSGLETGNLTITSNMPDYDSIVIPLTGTGFVDAAPVASEVQISGIPVVTMLQTASYTYTDADNDLQGQTAIQWYRITNGNSAPIATATDVTYRITAADIGSQIAFQVTPVDEHGMPGIPVMSPATPTIEVLPSPENMAAQIVNENPDVTLTWDPPAFYTRDFIGYKVFRNNLVINTINNPGVTTFTDTYVYTGTHQYWVTALYSNPVSQSAPSNVVTIQVGTANDDNNLPVVESVSIYPNPFRANANIRVISKAHVPVEAGIYNVKGQLVMNLTATTDSQGNASLELQRTNDMISGVYFVKVQTPEKSFTNKVIVLQ
jgi:hypothetical protein